MDITVAAGLIALGLVLLTGGGEALVRGATALAQLAGLTPAVIGLTVVAMGTSLPELVVSVLAAVQGQPDLAVGNVVGSNIFNVAATLGLTALILPLPVHGNAVRLEWPFMFLASILLMLLARDGQLDRMEGGFFLLSLAAFISYTVHVGRRDVRGAELTEIAGNVEARSLTPRWRRLATALAIVLLGVVLLVIGGRFLVDGAVTIARLAGISERIIGLTIVAAGTGAPELATSLVAAYRRRSDVAVANMIGSNVFNILGILGITALVTPTAVSAGIRGSDIWWMLGTSALLLPFLLTRRTIQRWEGGVLLASYAVYVGVLLG